MSPAPPPPSHRRYAKDHNFAIPAVNCVTSSSINACLEAARKAGESGVEEPGPGIVVGYVSKTGRERED